MTGTEIHATGVYVYALGLVSLSACAPAAMPPGQVADAANAQAPTGITSQWAIAGEPFKDGTPNPCPCDHNPDGRRHYLLHC